MRQLRLRGEDAGYAFLYQGNRSEAEIAEIKHCLEEQKESLHGHSFAEKPLCIMAAGLVFKAGFVPCDKETVVRLPDKGDVFISGSEGGYIVAAEWQTGQSR